MPNVPSKEVIKTKRVEWTIGESDGPTDAKDFRFGLHHIYKEMENLGVDLTYDDAFYVRAGDGGEIILYVEIEK